MTCPLMEDGGAIVGMDFDAQVAWPVYDWMGVAKAGARGRLALPGARPRPARRAREPRVAPGPLGTLAARGIPGFERPRRRVADARRRWAGTPRTPARSPAPCCFLLCDLARAITGEILHVDGGFHAMGTAPVGRDARGGGWREAGRLPDRRHRLPRHGGARAPARGGRPRGARARARGRRRGAPSARLDDVLATLWDDPSPYRDRVRAVARRRSPQPGLGLGDAGATRSPSAAQRGAALRGLDLVRPAARRRRARSTSTARARARLRARGAGARRPRALRARLDRLRRRPPRGHVPRAPARRRPGVPQHLRADEGEAEQIVGDGRATSGPRSRGRASSWASPTRAGRPAFNVLYWPLQAFSRGLFKERARRCPTAASTSSRSTTSPTRSCTCSTAARPACSTSSPGATPPTVDELDHARLGVLRQAGARRSSSRSTRDVATTTTGLRAVLRHAGRLRRRPRALRAGPGGHRGAAAARLLRRSSWSTPQAARWGKQKMTREAARARRAELAAT